MKHHPAPPHGFTFLETMLIVIVLALLLSVGLNKMGGSWDFGKVIQAKGDIQNLSNALQIYKSENGIYPSTAQGLRALIIRPLLPPAPSRWRCLVDATMIPRDPWDNAFHYACPGRQHPESFDLFSCGPDGVPNTADDINN